MYVIFFLLALNSANGKTKSGVMAQSENRQWVLASNISSNRQAQEGRALCSSALLLTTGLEHHFQSHPVGSFGAIDRMQAGVVTDRPGLAFRDCQEHAVPWTSHWTSLGLHFLPEKLT